MQENIWISDEIMIQTWIEDGVRWYPLSTIEKVIFLRDGMSMVQLKKGGWDKYCKQVKLSYKNQQGVLSCNLTNVMSQDGFKQYILKKKIGILDIEQKKNYNLLLEYLGINKKIEEKDKVVDKISKEEIAKYNKYCKEIHKELNSTKYALCNKCQVYYPIHKTFYPIHEDYEYGFNISTCKKCIRGYFDGEKRNDTDIKIDNESAMTKKIKIINKELRGFPKEFYTKENILQLFVELKDKEKVTYKNFSKDKHREVIGEYKMDFSDAIKAISYFDLTIELFGIDFYCRPYVYKDRSLKRDLQDFDFQKKVFDNYLNDKGIVIDNPITFRYSDIINKACIHVGDKYNNGANDYIDFVDKYNNCNYPAYKYKVVSPKYWSSKDNRIIALKGFVAELNLSNINKLPIYLTKYTLNNTSGTMYNIYRKYYDNLFDWVNECYPNMFEFSDFNTNIQRNEFDSLEEKAVNDILKEKFGRDLIYNNGDGMTRFTLYNKYQPDWIILRYKPIVVEYFGMYSESYTDKSTLVKYYNEKMPKKIEHYESLKNYDKLYIYPYDLKNNYEGLYKKLEDYI